MVVWCYVFLNQEPSVSLSPFFNVPYCGSSSSDAPHNHLTSNRTGGTYCLYKTQTQYKTNVQNSQQIILGSKTVWKNEICTWKKQKTT